MARIRTIKPEFWVDDVMVELPIETRLLFIGLWNFVDDEGYIEDKPKRIKMMIFPADDVLIEDSLNALCASGRLHAFDSDQGPLLRVANWERHQKINRASSTRFTGITAKNGRDSVRTHGAVSEHSRGKGKEGKGKEGKGRERKKPSYDSEISHDCNAREFSQAEIDEVSKQLGDLTGEPMDELETLVAIDLIVEAATSPVGDVVAYVNASIASTPDRLRGLCSEARRQVERTRAA